MTTDQAPTYRALTLGLPEFVNLRGLVTVAGQYGIQVATFRQRPDICWPSEQEGPLFERASIAALLDALAEAGVDVHHAASGGHDMTHADYWSTYCRRSAEEAGDLAPVAEYVDWAGYAASMRTDMVEVTVRDGQFAGSWYLRR